MSVPRRTKRMKPERADMIALFDYIELKYPDEWHTSFHIPNEGKRNPVEGQLLKRMGLKAGAPDMLMLVARKGYYGLAVEHKAKQKNGIFGKPTQKQLACLTNISAQGYFTKVTYGLDDAIATIDWYLG